jgi:pyruvate dehydrogenase E1 component alpha subunit
MDPATERNRLIKHLHDMIRIRRMEEKCAELYTKGKIRGFLHLAIGEEAIAVGATGSLRLQDAVTATYREHGHALIKGMSMRSIMAEMFGKVEGCCRGRGGSMHLFDKATNFFGGNAIVGAQFPLAVGIGLGYKMQGKDAIACCIFGEGAMAEGEWHEAMNLAALWQVPVLFLCENNYYAMGTALERSQASTNLIARASVYHITSESVDGMDVLAVERAAQRAMEHIRETGSPYFLECRTYRFRAHSMFDPELYRDKKEVEEWKKKDPILLLEHKLREEYGLTDKEVDEVEGMVIDEVDDAVNYAENGQLEAVEDLTKYVYSE